jgi:hypothetical protein
MSSIAGSNKPSERWSSSKDGSERFKGGKTKPRSSFWDDASGFAAVAVVDAADPDGAGLEGPEPDEAETVDASRGAPARGRRFPEAVEFATAGVGAEAETGAGAGDRVASVSGAMGGSEGRCRIRGRCLVADVEAPAAL